MSKIFHVMYDDDAKVMAAADELVGQGVRVKAAAVAAQTAQVSHLIMAVAFVHGCRRRLAYRSRPALVY